MDKFYYEMLKFLNECPDYMISKEVMYNALKWPYTKIDAVIDDLLEMKCIKSRNYIDVIKYGINFKGNVFLDEYSKKTVQEKENLNISKKVTTLSKLTTILDYIVNLIKK